MPEIIEQRTVPRPVTGPSSRYVSVFEQCGGQRYDLKPAGYGLIERMSAAGRDITSIARALGITRETFRIMRKRDPDAQEALERGRAALGDELHDILLEHARKGISIAAIFLAKARCGWREGEPMAGTNVTNNTQINIQIPERMSDEEFRAIINGAQHGQ